MILTLKLPAGPSELFSRTAADKMVGQTFSVPEHKILDVGQVLKAEVVEYGRAILLTIEWPNPTDWFGV